MSGSFIITDFINEVIAKINATFRKSISTINKNDIIKNNDMEGFTNIDLYSQQPISAIPQKGSIITEQYLKSIEQISSDIDNYNNHRMSCTSCFGGCLNTCTGCSGCAGDCGGSCYPGCSGTDWGCFFACNCGGSGSGCSHGCSGGCDGGCSRTCDSSCDGRCQSHCGNSCTTSCNSSCINNCADTNRIGTIK